MAATPAADMKDLPKAYQFIIDMPGLKAGDTKLSIEDDTVLVVTGERKRKEEKEGVQYVRMERVGEFMRKFVLPENAKTDAISAVCQDGVLTVTLEKLPPSQPKNPKTIEDKMPRNRRYGEAPLEAHHPTHLNPVVPIPLPLVAPPAINEIFQNALLNRSQQQQQQQWYQEQQQQQQQQWYQQQQQLQQQWYQEQPPEVDWYLKMRRVDAPSFDGMQDPSTAENWIRQMETLYRAMKVPNEKRVSVAVPFLTERAEEWYETVKGTYGILDWTTFKQLFNKNYITASYRVQKQREFYSLSQEGMTVCEYANEFTALLRYVPAILTDEECKVECFKAGLDYNIRCKLCAWNRFGSYEDVYDAALQVEGLLKRMKRRRNSP